MKEISVAQFKDVVEVGLQHHFGRYGRYSEFSGQLSVYPDRVGKIVTPDTLEFQCEDFSKELRRVEPKFGLKTHLSVSGANNGDHLYLIPDESYGLPDVLIDLTVGQYVHGHNHAFVGSRSELKDIVVLQTGEKGPYELVEPSELVEPEEFELYKEPTKFFQRKWGNTSIKV